MKKFVLTTVLAVISSVALAIPSPRQIEDSLAAKKYSDARSMVGEVLREKPDSARAHLLEAFLLVHVDHDREAANEELRTASRLDKSGDVKSSPLFGRVVAEIDAQPTKSVSQNDGHHGSVYGSVLAGTLFILGIIALMCGIIYMVFRRNSDASNYSCTHVSPNAPPAPPARAETQNSQNSYGYYPHAATTVVQSPTNSVMSAFGTAAAVAGGVVAGEVLAETLLHRHRERDGDQEDRYVRDTPTEWIDSGPSPVSYEDERSSLSSSSGDSDSWSSSDSSSSYDDISSSSSWD